MAIAYATQAQREALVTAITNTELAVYQYRSDSDNPAMRTAIDAKLADLKTKLDVVVAAVGP